MYSKMSATLVDSVAAVAERESYRRVEAISG